MKKHTFIMCVVSRACKEAGLLVKVEPDTHGLLLGEFSKADCRRIFPKNASKHFKSLFTDMLAAVDFVAAR